MVAGGKGRFLLLLLKRGGGGSLGGRRSSSICLCLKFCRGVCCVSGIGSGLRWQTLVGMLHSAKKHHQIRPRPPLPRTASLCV